MGQAKRRRKAAAGSGEAAPPSMGQFIQSGPVEEFRVPTGMLAITTEIDDHPPSTFMIEAAKVGDIAAKLKELHRHRMPRYGAVVDYIAKEVVKARQRGGPSPDNAALVVVLLGTVLHHPQFGEQASAMISRALASDNRCQITWRKSAKGLAIAVGGDQYADLDNFLTHMPRDRVVVAVVASDGSPDPSKH